MPPIAGIPLRDGADLACLLAHPVRAAWSLKCCLPRTIRGCLHLLCLMLVLELTLLVPSFSIVSTMVVDVRPFEPLDRGSYSAQDG